MSDRTLAPEARPSAVVEQVLEALEVEGSLAPDTIRSWTHVMGQFARFLERGHEIHDLDDVTDSVVRGFLLAPSRDGVVPNPSVQHLRRCGVRCLYRTARRLGLATGDPTLDVDLPTWAGRSFRPLTDDEVDLCRAVSIANQTPGPAVMWALSEATARTGELPALRVGDLDLAGGRVWLAGTQSVARRWGALTEWGRLQLQHRLVNLQADPSTPLLLNRHTGTTPSSSTSVGVISKVLARAGLERSMGVRPVSVAAWVGRNVFDQTGRIDLVAARCGVRSLDAAARLICWDWQDPDG